MKRLYFKIPCLLFDIFFPDDTNPLLPLFFDPWSTSHKIETKIFEIPLCPPFSSPHWGEGGGEGVKSVRRKFSGLLGKNLCFFRDFAPEEVAPMQGS
jgi:hypothetical protein